MSHGVHAVQHEVEHELEHEEHGHGGHKPTGIESLNKKVALLIAVIALFLAFSETLGKSAQTAALSFNVEASNLWAFYQAKTIRQTSLQAANEVLKIERLKIWFRMFSPGRASRTFKLLRRIRHRMQARAAT